MCSMSVLCPLCAVPSFGSIDALQQRLIKAANGPLACPFPQCKELFLGLDKLTIHLFSHTSLMMMTSEKRINTEHSMTETTNTAAPTTTKRKGKKLKQTAVKDERLTEQLLVSPTPNMNTASCDICEFNFRNSELRDMHFRLVHENVTDCSPQTMTMPPSEEPYKCHLCAKTFKMKGSLRVHLKVVHMMGRLPCVNDTPHKLNICDRIRHKEAAAAAASSSAVSNNTTITSTTTQPYALSGAVSMLIQQPAGDINTVPMSSNAEALTNSSDANPKIWACDVCTKHFTTKYFLKKHKRLHTGEMPYTCQICARTFTFQQSYHKHLLYHSEIKPHVCGVCGRAFKELSTLHNHERIHSGEKPFKCEVCGKCFRQRVSFLVHTRIHTGAMPYKCELCQKTFRYKVSQRTHKCAPTAVNTLDTNEEHEANESPEQFIKAFLECNGGSNDTQHSPASAEIAAINDPHVSAEQNEALLSQTIDDIVVESCQKLGICGDNNLGPMEQQQHTNVVGICNFNESSSSPLQQLQRLRLFSPQLGVSEDAALPVEGVAASELFGRFLMDST